MNIFKRKPKIIETKNFYPDWSKPHDHFLSPVTPEAKKAIEKAVKHSVKKYEKTYRMLADERLKITPKQAVDSFIKRFPGASEALAKPLSKEVK